MSNLVVLNNELHKNLKIDQNKVESIGAAERLVPVVISEFLKLSVHYPIVLTKNEESGKFVCVSMLGFEQGENLFWKSNRWNAIYIPLNITRQPFFLGKEDPSKTDYLICIDDTSPCIIKDENNQADGEALYQENGEESSYMGKVRSILAALINGEAQNHNFIQTLIEYDLIMPLALDITFVNNEKQSVQGIYTIDEEKLEKLSDERLLNLHKKHYLKPIYTMVMSLSHMYSLIQKKNEKILGQ